MKKFKYGNSPSFVVKEPIVKTAKTNQTQSQKLLDTEGPTNLKSPKENINSNFSIVDQKVKSVDVKINSKKSNQGVNPEEGVSKLSNFKTKEAVELEKNNEYDKNPSSYTKKATSQSTSRKKKILRDQVNMNIINGPGGWKL
jgi:hypothetical protein